MRIGSGLRPVTLVFAVLLFSRQHWGYEEVLKDPKEGIPYQPWAKALIAFDLSWNPNGEIMEYICQENNLWLKRLLKQVPE